jgi:hypothetical protein
MKLFLSVGILIAILTTGCSDNSPVDKSIPPIIDVHEQDIEMRAAIVEAQATLANFVNALKTPQTNQEYFLIKGKFTARDIAELALPRFGGQVLGECIETWVF